MMALRPQGLVTGAQLRRLLGSAQRASNAASRRAGSGMTGDRRSCALDGVSKHFGGLRVIEDLSFAVRRGIAHGADRP